MLVQYLALAALVWCLAVLLVIAIGIWQLYKHFHNHPIPISPTLPFPLVPHVTIIRPIKGLEPYLTSCLVSTFTQAYPSKKLTIYLCVSSSHDPALPILRELLSAHYEADAKIFIEDEDPLLRREDGNEGNLGPNPKIRNMSRAYREAKGDIVWVADCNVWLSNDVTGRMVDLLCGFERETTITTTPNSGYSSKSMDNGIGKGKSKSKSKSKRRKKKKYGFVHQLPLAVDISHFPFPPPSSSSSSFSSSSPPHPQNGKRPNLPPHHSPSPPPPPSLFQSAWNRGGGLLEEMFLSTSHAKFYTAISTVAVAPCTVGKSNMFRKSHLDALTAAATTTSSSPSAAKNGIDFFSHNICEDHLISDLIWKQKVPAEIRRGAEREGQEEEEEVEGAEGTTSWSPHALLPSPPCIQPLSRLSVGTYFARRSRWLRVRKFTVPMATLVEPGTESFVASLLGAWSLTTLSWSSSTLGIPQTWSTFWLIFGLSIMVWMGVDWWLWGLLQSWNGGGEKGGEGTEEMGGDGEVFVGRGFVGSAVERRSEGWKGKVEWVFAWLGREALAGPIWMWAVLGGREVVWRGRRFRVGLDARVMEVEAKEEKEKGKEEVKKAV